MPAYSQVQRVEIELFRAPFDIAPIDKAEIDVKEYENLLPLVKGAIRTDYQVKKEDRLGQITLSLIDGTQVQVEYYWAGKGGMHILVGRDVYYMLSDDNKDLGFVLSRQLSEAHNRKKK